MNPNSIDAIHNLETLQTEIQLLASQNKRVELAKLLEGMAFYPLAIKTAAKEGHHSLVTHLLQEAGVTAGPHYSVAEIALLNDALIGYVAGGHFAEVKKLVAKGANLFHGLNVLIENKTLNQENFDALLACCKKAEQRTRLVETFNKIDRLEPSHTLSL